MADNNMVKCPQCGGKVSRDGRACICSNCGYIFIPKDENMYAASGTNPYQSTNTGTGMYQGTNTSTGANMYQNGSMNSGSNPYHNAGSSGTYSYQNTNMNTNAYSYQNANINQRQYVSGNIPQNTTGKKGNGKVIAFVIGIIAVPLIGFLALVFFVALAYMKSNSNDTDSTSSSISQSEEISSAEADDNSLTESIGDGNLIAARDTLIDELVWRIFGKNLDEVTQEELDSVVELDFDEFSRDTYIMGYSLEDGTSGSFLTTFDQLPLEYLPYFTNLQDLELRVGTIRGDSLRSLKNLNSLSGEFYDDFNTVCNPEQISYLGFYGGYGIMSEESLASFTSLQGLTLDCDDISDLSCLNAKTDLYELAILDADRIEDFSILYQMENLDYLYIQSSQLKDIGFVSNMPNLMGFGIEDTKVLNVDALEPYKEQLYSLYLLDNSDLEPCDFVSDMINLENLELSHRYDPNRTETDYRIPDLSNLTNLVTLSLKGYEDFASMEKLINLESLSLENIGYGNPLPQIRELPKLDELYMEDASICNEVIKDIAANENITYIDFEDAFLWGDISPILNMPNLMQLNMKNAEGGIIFDNVNTNESMLYLDMEGTRLNPVKENGEWDYSNDVEYVFAEHLDMFAAFPELLYLSVPSHEIQSVDFVSALQELEILNVEDNYITDISPAVDLPYCRVLCDNNPIAY